MRGTYDRTTLLAGALAASIVPLVAYLTDEIVAAYIGGAVLVAAVVTAVAELRPSREGEMIEGVGVARRGNGGARFSKDPEPAGAERGRARR